MKDTQPAVDCPDHWFELLSALLCVVASLGFSGEGNLPYHPPCTERENLFEFTQKPAVVNLGHDRYEITFAVKGFCDVCVSVVGADGAVVRHLGAGVLGANAPAPFQKNARRQTLFWNGKDDLGEYVKNPEELKVRVMLGLKPEFDKRLGVTNPKSIPGTAWGLCGDESGMYLLAGSDGLCGIRKFGLDGGYLGTIFPPPANLPQDQYAGSGFVEYEPGKRALHTVDLESVWGEPTAGSPPQAISKRVFSCQPALVNGRIYYLATPDPRMLTALLYFVGTGGATEAKGVAGRQLNMSRMARPNLVASPDGRWLYMAGDDESGSYAETMACTVFRTTVAGDEPGAVFAGVPGKPGSDNAHFNRVQGVACDRQGRVYACDNRNNRVQVFSPDGKHLKSIAVDRPVQIQIHRKTDALYVMHAARIEGRSVNRITKFGSFEQPAAESHFDPPAGLMALDAWSPRPRIWLAGTVGKGQGELMDGRFEIAGANVTIWEEERGGFRKVADFSEEVQAQTGTARAGPWPGGISKFRKVVCDPVREKAYYMNSWVFDLKGGARLDDLSLPGKIDDIAFDKRRYLHCHFNPGFYQQGVGRLDPGLVRPDGRLTECPYDYGEVSARGDWSGVLPVRDQPGAKFFQDGIGVNMLGEVAENSIIYYAPKRDEVATGFFPQMTDNSGSPRTYAGFMRQVEDLQKRGQTVYSIRPTPGVPLTGATIWTFESSGELRGECAAIAGRYINGVTMDEDGALYFVTMRTRVLGGKPFLAGRGGVFGAGADGKPLDPFTGTLVKSGKIVRILSSSAPVPMDQAPKRPPDLHHGRDGEKAWVEGAEWLYAGASPIISHGCSCPTMRFHTDWHKRTFVPEAYRHSIGVLDSAGNLLLHIGQYGNFDSGYGPESRIPVGGDGLAFSDARMVGGTDRYLCIADRGDRLIVLKLNYHAEETVPILVK